MDYIEIETKYNADHVSLEEFNNLMEPFGHDKKMMVSSYDDYFIDKDNNFIRYRYSDDRGELTIKRKTTDKNNLNRVEVNLPTNGDDFKTVEAFCNLLNYKHNFGIYKTCRIYWVDNAVVVWYVVYDKSMKELRRFIEIEADEDHEWASEEEAWEKVVEWEHKLKSIGITSRNRLKKSLFEMFLSSP